MYYTALFQKDQFITMKTTVIFIVLTTTFLQNILCDEFQKVYQWKQLAHRKQEDTGIFKLMLKAYRITFNTTPYPSQKQYRIPGANPATTIILQ